MASEATIARDLRDARFQDAFRIPPAIDPSTMGQRGSGVDALKRVEKVPMPTSGGSNVQNPWSARSGLEKQIPKLGDMLDDSAGRRKLPNGQQYLKKAAGPQHVAEALAKANKAYTQIFNIWQSSFLTSTLALEIFVSPWVFLLLFFARVIGSLTPIRIRGINIIPPYTLKGGGIGVLISHLGGVLLILVVLTIILVIIALVAIFFSSTTWEKVNLIYDFGTTGLKVLYDLLHS